MEFSGYSFRLYRINDQKPVGSHYFLLFFSHSMKLFPTPSGYRNLALAVALALPGLAVAQQGTPIAQALASFGD
jgi:hypothetical protein